MIVNNQIGFTTPPSEGRSSTYASDVAKMLKIPIFHVNGENPEAVAQVVTLAMDFRRKFRRDVVIDMYAYRRRGHNEGDEPAFTQPLMYRAIEGRKPVREGYLEHLLALGGVTREEADRIAEECRERLEKGLAAVRSGDYSLRTEAYGGIWTGYRGGAEGAWEEVLAGRRGIVRISPDGNEAQIVVAGMNVVGLAFGPLGEMVVATNDAVFSLPLGIHGALLKDAE